MILYRPVGEKEYELIEQSGFKKFPPRLPEQPIFYPVVNSRYAGIWNKQDKNSGFKAYVLEFQISDEYIEKYNVQTVGARYHQEYWIPADQLDTFNNHIIGDIKVIKEM